ncbi:Shikimate kinase 1 [Apilactobacillus kunkeei]|uniref:shikimate kinase n=1 Tax=Apilactobacillus waqarii TaxID=2851006 RepID=UPI0021FEB6AD|nr:Shikimate kinase 1 [Apilactobacillus kunkeei]CAI2556739.1 Shikimate kinase 1 [Apilactobacillus kunkeei]CAI2557258.1 Shikimate kinase 1 [Apilactobacillus kunkeei]CAI2557263.1 Shikimate kinase 1 [Apilactobacillus kunkeei]CAI2557355.1 Shikimate kinase 1 [Apilactobacillus kunkeei]
MDAIIIGFMGSGKTTVTQLLAEKLNVKFMDLDSLIVDSIGQSISDFFKDNSEEKFREVETQVLKQSVSLNGILATGGGTPIYNVDVIKEMDLPVFLLDAKDETIQRRLSENEGRPLVDKHGLNGIIELKHERDVIYNELSDYTIFTDDKTPLEVADEILNILSK